MRNGGSTITFAAMLAPRPVRGRSTSIRLFSPQWLTADNLALIGSATRTFQGIWQPGYRYAKVGVLLPQDEMGDA
jgi:hypothetical protein